MGANSGTIEGHDVTNYYVGKGILYIQLLTDAAFVDCGNVPTFTMLPKPTLLDHFSSRTGTMTKDYVAVTKKEATLTIELEEFSARNLALALMGAYHDSPSPGDTAVIEIMGESIINGALKFVGKNDVGPQWTVLFPSVNFTPGKVISLIGDTWGGMEITGDVLANSAGVFGTASATLPNTPYN
jgi:hypothetical protein